MNKAKGISKTPAKKSNSYAKKGGMALVVVTALIGGFTAIGKTAVTQYFKQESPVAISTPEPTSKPIPTPIIYPGILINGNNNSNVGNSGNNIGNTINNYSSPQPTLSPQ